jgi:hypothetical protein
VLENPPPNRKRCSTCKQWKTLDEFNRRMTSADGRQWSCRECNRAYHRRNKQRHNAQIHARNRRINAENQRRLWEFLLTHPCVDCGETDPVVLEFDHLRDKEANVSRLLHGWPWRAIENEIGKCEAVCANCHRRRTCERAQSWRVVGFGHDSGTLPL